MYYSLDGHGAFWKAHARDARSSPGDYEFGDFSFLETGGAAGAAELIFQLFCFAGLAFFFFFFARSSQERAVPRAQEGARQSRRVRRAAGLAAVAGERAGKKRRPSGRERRAERVLFLDAPAPAPAPPARSPGSSRSAGPGIPHTPDRPPSCCCLSPLLLHLASRPNFPQPGLVRVHTDRQTDIHNTHTPSPLPRLQLHFPV